MVMKISENKLGGKAENAESCRGDLLSIIFTIFCIYAMLKYKKTYRKEVKI